MLRAMLRPLGVAVMAGYGVVLGLLWGHLWLVFVAVPSPLAFLNRRNLWAIEAPIYVISATFGASTAAWFALGLVKGHFGFAASTSRDQRVRHAALGATYGAFAGAVLSTFAALSVGLVLARGPNMAASVWATHPHWVVLSEVAFGMFVGGIVGAALGVALPRAATTPPDVAVVPSSGGRSESYRVLTIILGAVLAYAVVFGVTYGSESRVRNALMIASSCALVYFSGLAAFLRTLLRLYGRPPHSRRPLLIYVRRWAMLTGFIGGSGIGLRLTIYAMASDWIEGGQHAWLAIAICGLAGSGVASILARLQAPSEPDSTPAS
jgi:hypothetical protein